MRAFDAATIAAVQSFLKQPIQLTPVRQKFGASARSAAVLVPLCNNNGVASILYTERSQTVSTHKGHVSFPGGHLEGSEDAIAAALRETVEELGAGVGPIDVLGWCQEVPAGNVILVATAYTEG